VYGSYALADDSEIKVDEYIGEVWEVIDGGIVVNDSTYVIAEDIVYLNTKNEEVAEIQFDSGDRIFFTTNEQGEISTIKKALAGAIPGEGKVSDDLTGEGGFSSPDGEVEGIRLEDGVWKN
jgi:hypothetical protein